MYASYASPATHWSPGEVITSNPLSAQRPRFSRGGSASHRGASAASRRRAARIKSLHVAPTSDGLDITPNTPMRTTDMSPVLTRLFSELVDGASDPTGAFILNSRDVGLLRSLDALSADDASRSVNDGATIAAHAQHLRYGLSLMNRWANEGGNPFADAKWDEAWKTFDVDATEWENIRNGLREEAHRWLQALSSPRDVTDVELAGMVASIAHLAYHLGAIRQIDKHARGPKEGTF